MIPVADRASLSLPILPRNIIVLAVGIIIALLGVRQFSIRPLKYVAYFGLNNKVCQ